MCVKTARSSSSSSSSSNDSSSSNSSSEGNGGCPTSEHAAQHTQHAQHPQHSAATCNAASADSGDDTSVESSTESGAKTPPPRTDRLNSPTSHKVRAIPPSIAAHPLSAPEVGPEHGNNSSSSPADSSEASSDDSSSDSGSPSDTTPPGNPEHQQYSKLDAFFAARVAAGTGGRGIAPHGMPRGSAPRGGGGRGGRGRSIGNTLGRAGRLGVLQLLRDAAFANKICTQGPSAPGRSGPDSMPRAPGSVAEKRQTTLAAPTLPADRSSLQPLQGGPNLKSTGATIAMQDICRSLQSSARC